MPCILEGVLTDFTLHLVTSGKAKNVDEVMSIRLIDDTKMQSFFKRRIAEPFPCNA